MLSGLVDDHLAEWLTAGQLYSLFEYLSLRVANNTRAGGCGQLALPSAIGLLRNMVCFSFHRFWLVEESEKKVGGYMNDGAS